MIGLEWLRRRAVVSGLVSGLVICLAITGTPWGVPVAQASIAPPPPAHEIYARADVVYVGVVTRVKDGRMWLRPVTVLHGQPSAEIPVLPVTSPSCTPGDVGESLFAVGDRVFVAAAAEKGLYRLIDHMVGDAKISTKADERARVAMAKEMLAIVRLDDAAERTRRLAGLLASKNAYLARAGADFVIREIDTPQKAKPIERELVAAVSSTNIWCRRAALSALGGVAPKGGFDAIAKRITSSDNWERSSACAALAAYDRADAVARIEQAAEAANDPFVLSNLGFSPRPEARTILRDMLLPLQGDKADDHRVHAGLRGYQFRLQTRDATDADVHDLMTYLKRGVLRAPWYELYAALALTRRASVADELLALLKPGSGASADQRRVCVGALWKLVQPEVEVAQDVTGRLRTEADLLVDLYDSGQDDVAMCWLLRAVHTDAARQALARRADDGPSDASRNAAAVLRTWDD